MKYPYRVSLVQEADGERYWVARSESLKGCIGTGDTPEDAVKELEENEITWLETAQEFGAEIPEVPFENVESFSGKFTARVSPAVHRIAAEQAKKQGISLNQYVNDAIVNYSAEIRTASVFSKAVTVAATEVQETIKRTSSSVPHIRLDFFGNYTVPAEEDDFSYRQVLSYAGTRS